jgi:hypothetical protein
MKAWKQTLSINDAKWFNNPVQNRLSGINLPVQIVSDVG